MAGAIELQQVARARGLDGQAFIERYVRPGIPVILEDFAQGWPALRKWTFDHFREVVGGNIVPLYDDSKVDPTRKVNEPVARMTLSDYLDVLEREPTQLRIFLYNIFAHAPQLCDDFKAPPWAPDVLTQYPMMFFGGAGSRVFMHYDMDLSHVFLTHFGGRKKAILFDNRYGKLLYRIPLAVHIHEDIDLEAPDLDRWPALRAVKGYEADLRHGDTLFMPSGMWHYMRYIDGSFSLALRALPSSPITKLNGLYNMVVMRGIDNLSRRFGGQRWLDLKDRWAVSNAESAYRGSGEAA